MLHVLTISVSCIKKSRTRMSAIGWNFYTVSCLMKVELHSRQNYKFCFLPAMSFKFFEDCDNTLHFFLLPVYHVLKKQELNSKQHQFLYSHLQMKFNAAQYKFINFAIYREWSWSYSKAVTICCMFSLSVSYALKKQNQEFQQLA